MENKIISIDITPDNNVEYVENAGVMWEHNATILKFKIDEAYLGDYRYYIEYRSLMGNKVRTEYLELNTDDNTITYAIPVSMSSLKGAECYFNIVAIDEDGNTIQVIKPRKFCLTFDYSPDTDNTLCKVNDFSINALLEAIRLGTFKGDKGDKGEKGDKGDKGETGGISEEYATQNFANALKGNLSGPFVVADDVSPVEHETTVFVRGKNLLDLSKAKFSRCSATENGVKLEIDNYHYCQLSLSYLNDLIQNNDGLSLTFSVGNMLEGAKISIVVMYQDSTFIEKSSATNSVTITVDNQGRTVSTLWLRPVSTSTAFTDAETVINNLQLEIGTEATEYVPYIDPTTITVTRCGKNLYDGDLLNGYYTNADFELTATSSLVFQSFKRFYPKGTYTVSFNEKVNIIRQVWSGNFTQGGINDANSFTFTVEEDCEFGFSFRKSDNTEWDKNSPIQIEYGNTVTDYEEYKGADYIPTEDGSVSGIKSIAPVMTLFTDAQDVIITVEYNKDLNKIIKKLIAAVNSLGGTV